MADSDQECRRRGRGTPRAIGGLHRFLTRPDVLAGIVIIILCASFFLETRAHRNLFYLAALPIFLLSLTRLEWPRIGQSRIAQLAFAYLGYFVVSALWSDGLSWTALGDLLRVSLLLLVFLVVVVHLAARGGRFIELLFFWIAASAGVSLVAVFAAAALGLLPFGRRLGGFGLTEHPVIGATLYGFALLVAAFGLLPRAANVRLRLALLATIALCTAFMLLTSSRGPLIALVAALIAGLTVASLRVALAIAVLVVAGICAGALFDLLPIELLYLRAQSGHFEIWQQAWTAVAERPWLGHGSLTDIDFVGKHGPARSPHNLFLANHLYGGVPATLLLAGLLALAAAQAWHTRREQPALLVLLVFGVAASLFDTRSLVQNLGREWITLWLPLGLLAAQEALRRERGESGAS